jgi:type I restriction enzyme R subunit
LDGYAEEDRLVRRIDAATDAIVEPMGSHEKMATRLLSDEAAREIFLGLLYEMLKRSDAPSLFSDRNQK